MKNFYSTITNKEQLENQKKTIENLERQASGYRAEINGLQQDLKESRFTNECLESRIRQLELENQKKIEEVMETVKQIIREHG